MEDISVDLTRHKTTTPAPLRDDEISKSALASQTFSISGMTCSSCVNTVERTLNEIPGVKASVNFASETVHILAPAQLKAEVIIRAIQGAGYAATLVDDQSDPALHRKGAARALIFAAIFAIPTIVISMAMSWHDEIGIWLTDLFTTYNIPLPPHSEHHFAAWVAIVLTAPLILIVAWPIHRAAMRNFFHPTMDSLISLGSIAAYSWSIYSAWTFTGDIYTEVAAGVLLFVILGRYLEARAKRIASSALSTLLALGEKDVSVLRSGIEVKIPISQLQVGDEFIVAPGARIATDGVIISGLSTVDNSLITGESLPIEVKPGSRVIGSALNHNGRIIVKASRVGSDTEIARITSMVVNAQGGKSPIQRLADRISSIFVPVVVLLALATFAIWYFVADETLAFSISTAITVLVIACPCALGLATPVALLVASGRGALRGIVLRNPKILEVSRTIDAAVFDKTGTLTSGNMQVSQLLIPVSAQKPLGQSYENILNEKNVSSLALALESANNHPFAEAIVNHCLANSAEKFTVTDFMQTPGAGVAGRVNAFGKELIVIIGSPQSVSHSTTAVDPILQVAIAKAESEGDSVALLAVDGVAIALFIAGDRVRSDAQATISALRERGVESWLVTGDNLEAANKVAAIVGIDPSRIFSSVSPEGKIDKVRQLQSEGHRVMAVGDGINDAAALAQADLSIAMGTGTDTAIATADITLMRPQLMGAIESLALSQKTLSTIRVNLGWAFSYNVIGIPIAAASLMSPMYAAAAMALSSLLVVTNSLRIR